MADIVLKDKRGNAVTYTGIETIEVPTESGEMQLFTAGTGGGLNIAYGDTVPSDKSKLWIKGEEPSSVSVSSATDKVTQLSQTLPSAETGAMSAAVGRKIYMFGGTNATEIKVFDTETETVTVLSAVLPDATTSSAVAVHGTKIYLFGGNLNSTYHGKVRVFNTETNTISTPYSTNKVPSRMAMSAVTVGDYIYLFGGQYKSGSTVYYGSEIYRFSPSSFTYTTLSVSLPYGNCNGKEAVVGTNVYLFSWGGSNYRSEIYKFDTVALTITKTAASAYGYLSGGSAIAAIGTKIYRLGGNIGGQNSNAILEFDTESENLTVMVSRVTEKQPLSYSFFGCVGRKVYLLGGNLQSTATNKIFVFEPFAELASNTVRIVTSGEGNPCQLVPDVDFHISKVYRGDSDNFPKVEQAYLYKDGAWVEVGA